MIGRLLLISIATADAGWAHGWRDQYIRVSQRLGQQISAKLREGRKLGLMEETPEHLKQAARDAMKHAERVHHARRHNDAQLRKPEHLRRKLMDVDCPAGTRTCTVNGVEHADMSLFDCPWINSLHPYLNTTMKPENFYATASLPGVEPVVDPITQSPHKYLRSRPGGTPFVDGGLCLPFQEIPFPFPGWMYGGVDFDAANIKTPGPDWNPDSGVCSTGPGTCEYPGDSKLFGGPTGVAENYGMAAAHFGWPSTSADSGEMDTPMCKTYVEDCKYSKKATRKYKYEQAAKDDPLTLGGGYDINWVLWMIGKIRNDLTIRGDGTSGATDMAEDLNGNVDPSYTFPGFPETLYELFYNKPDGTEPPTEGHYPHAFVKGQFAGDFVDTSKDGECSVTDAQTQWMDCGIPCPIGEESRMSKDDLAPFGGVVLAFMFVCALIGAAAMLVVGKSSDRFFVGGRTLNIFVVTATLASQSLDSNAALGNIDLGYNYHWWDGAALPIGLGLSLVLNGIFFAKPLNEMRLLTLPDLFARKFGQATS